MNKLIYTFLHNSIYVYILIITIFLFGIWGAIQIKQELIPSHYSLSFNLETRYQNYPAVIVEKVITKPLEEKLSSLKNLKSISAISETGKSTLAVTFNEQASYTSALIDLYEIADAFSLNLPSDSEKTVVLNYQSDDNPDFVLSYSSTNLSPQELREVLEQELSPKIKRIPSVANVEIYGGEIKELVIELKKKYSDNYPNIDRLIQQSLLNNNFFSKLGEINNGQNLDTYYLNNKITNHSQLEEFYISTAEQKPLLFKDVTDFFVTGREENDLSFANGHEDVALVILVNKNSSLLETGEKITAALKLENQKLNKRFANSIFPIYVLNTYEQIVDELNRLYQSLFVGAIFVIIFVFFILRNIYLTLIIVIGIPFSLSGIIFILTLIEISLNMYSLIGISLVSGMLLDVSIILIEKYTLQESIYQKADSRKTIIYHQTLDTLNPLLIGFITSIVIFLPILFLPNFIRSQFNDIAITISLGLFFSFIYAVFVLPSLVLRWGKLDYSPKIEVSTDKKNYQIYFRILCFIRNYNKIITSLLIFTLTVMISLLLITGRYDFKEISHDSKIAINYEFNPGTKMKNMKEETLKLYEKLKQAFPQIKDVFIKISKYRSVLTVECKNTFENCYESIKDFIRQKEKNPFIGDIHVDSSSIANSKATQHSLGIDLIGLDYDSIEENIFKAGNQLLQSGFTEELFYHFRKDFKEFIYEFNKEKMFAWKLSPSSMAENIFFRKEGYIADKYIPNRTPGSEVSALERDIKVISKDDQKGSLSKIQNLIINSPTPNSVSSSIQLENIGDIKSGFTLSKRYRKNKNKTLSFTINSLPGTSYSEFYNQAKNELMKIKLPERYYFEINDKKNFENLTQFLIIYFICIAYLIYMSCASIYHSFAKPILILNALLISILANLILILYNDATFDLPTVLAIAVVLGLGVNNITIFFDEMEKIANKTSNTFSIIVGSFIRKKNSVFISSGSTMIALIPALFSDNLFFETISQHLIIGLFWNLVFTIFIFPNLFLWFKKNTAKTI